MLSVIILHTAAVRCPISVVLWIICRVSVDHFLFLLTPGCYQYLQRSHWSIHRNPRLWLVKLSGAGMTLSALTSPISRSPIIKGYFLTYTPVTPGLLQQNCNLDRCGLSKNSRGSILDFIFRDTEYWVLTVRIIRLGISGRSRAESMRAVLHKWDLEVNRIREFRLRDNGKCDIKSDVMWWWLSQSIYSLVNYNRALTSIVRIFWEYCEYMQIIIPRLASDCLICRLITLLASPDQTYSHSNICK